MARTGRGVVDRKGTDHKRHANTGYSTKVGVLTGDVLALNAAQSSAQSSFKMQWLIVLMLWLGTLLVAVDVSIIGGYA